MPKELRTDRLSAVSRNRDGSYVLDITPCYQALYAHYGLSPSCNNRGGAHENRIVEAPHGHVKRRLEQKLISRGSCDSEEPAEYGELLAFRCADYELLTLRVRSTTGSYSAKHSTGSGCRYNRSITSFPCTSAQLFRPAVT